MSWNYRVVGKGSDIGPDVEAKLGSHIPPLTTEKGVPPRPGSTEDPIKQKIKEIIQIAAAAGADVGFVIDAHGTESVSDNRVTSVNVSLKIDTAHFAGK